MAMCPEMLQELFLLVPSAVQPLLESLWVAVRDVLDPKPAPVSVSERSLSALDVQDL